MVTSPGGCQSLPVRGWFAGRSSGFAMKAILGILAVGAVCVGGVFVAVNQRQAGERARERAAAAAELQALRAENEKLAADLELARRHFPSPAAGADPVVYAGPSPADAVTKLTTLRFGQGEQRRNVTWHIIQQFRNLNDAGPAAVPAIREFLRGMEDIDYLVGQGQPGEVPGERRSLPWTRGRASRASLDFDFPPSLRIGLVDVLREIGGPAAEQALAEVLNTTGRPVELAYVARTLEELAPGKYRETAVTAARELLVNPPPLAGANRLDDSGRAYLLGVLATYGDTSFGPIAQTLLIGPDGRIDRSVLNYLDSTLQEQSMPAIYQAYSDPRVTNLIEKAALVTVAFNHVGSNPQANQIFAAVIADENTPAVVRALAVASLAGGGRGPVRAESPTDPQVIQQRIDLLQQTRGTITDGRMIEAVDKTIQNLNNLSEGKPIDETAVDFRPDRSGIGTGGGRRRGGG